MEKMENSTSAPAAVADPHALAVLEFPGLLRLIATRAASEPGRDRVLAFVPAPTPAAATAAHPLLADLLSLQEAGVRLPQPSFPDLAPILRRATPEAVLLPPEELLLCRRFLDAVADLLELARRPEAAVRPALAERLGRLHAPDPLRTALRRAIDDDGQIADTASPRLAQLRAQLRDQEKRLQQYLEAVCRRWADTGLLQDAYVTERNGRLVLPVRRELRNRASGIIHDHSDSGRTLFIEPAEAVTLGNELTDLRLEERDECRRILADLTARIRLAAADLHDDAHTLAELDAALAVTDWAADYACVLPRFGPALRLCDARHPLLLERFRRDQRETALVPLDLDLPATARTLVISGANCGGKTAALKTAGLLTLAAQAGLPVPAAPGSEFRIFARVLADIGDEQSLAANLSTFTGHLARLQTFLTADAAAGALVLLDELGAATDPLEGGALACAVLEALAAIPGSLTLATTHLGTVKTFAQERPDMLNAAVRFNSATLAPEYRLDPGRPGASQALAIAARTGFPAAILDRARGLLSADHLRLETLIATVEEDRRRLAAQEQQLAESLDAVTRDRTRLTTELADLRAERRRLLHEASRQAAGIVDNAQRDVNQLLRDARQQPPADARAEQQLRDRLRERGEKLQETVKTSAPKPRQPLPPADLVPGRTVWVASLETNAVIERVSDDRRQVTVETGGLHVTVDAAAVGRRNAQQPARNPATAAKLIRPRAPDAVPGELNLVGKRVEEALSVLDHYLDQAAFSGRPEARIVHGFGSGRLQAAVHDFLRGHPLVANFRLGKGSVDLGGGGITLITFRRRE